MAASVILMESLLTKYSIVSTLKKTDFSLRSKFVKRKRNLSFEVGRYLFASKKD